MEATALCVSLFLHVFMLLVTKDQLCYSSYKCEAASLHIVVNRLQLFEYQSITCDCLGFGEFTKWRVMRTVMGVRTICGAGWETSTGPCHIKHAYEADSGEYWCETHDGRRSSLVNITVTAGSVILKSPAVPVTEEEDVTLICINQTSTSVPVADFYKNGLLMGTGYRGNITIHNVSKSDEGFYKCDITGVGESPESWLAVRSETTPASPEEHPSPHRSSDDLVVIMGIICLVAVLLTMVGLGLCWKHRALICHYHDNIVSRSQSSLTETVSEVNSAAPPQRAIYSLITTPGSCDESAESRGQAAAVTDQTITADCIFYDTGH